MIATLLVAIIMFLLFRSCDSKSKTLGEAIEERDSLPSMVTLGVTNLVSDSGVTRYRIITEEWEIYDKKKPPYWSFEKGVYLEKFDSVFDIEARIKADTAYYFMDEKLWKLVSNVDIENTKGERFETDLMYWDQVTEKIYSDEYVKITQPDKVIAGYGFESNQQLTVHRFRQIQGEFDFDDDALAVRNDSVTKDTTQTRSASRANPALAVPVAPVEGNDVLPEPE